MTRTGGRGDGGLPEGRGHLLGLGRPVKTVVREIRARRRESDKGAFGRVKNRCAHRAECQERKLGASHSAFRAR